MTTADDFLMTLSVDVGQIGTQKTHTKQKTSVSSFCLVSFDASFFQYKFDDVLRFYDCLTSGTTDLSGPGVRFSAGYIAIPELCPWVTALWF